MQRLTLQVRMWLNSVMLISINGHPRACWYFKKKPLMRMMIDQLDPSWWLRPLDHISMTPTFRESGWLSSMPKNAKWSTLLKSNFSFRQKNVHGWLLPIISNSYRVRHPNSKLKARTQFWETSTTSSAITQICISTRSSSMNSSTLSILKAWSTKSKLRGLANLP